MIRITLSFLLYFTCSCAAMAEEKQRIIINDIYKYALTDIERTKQLIHELKKEKKTPLYEINLIEGDVHFNRSYYYMALNFYKRALYDERIRDSIDWQKNLIVRVIPCYHNINDISSMKFFCQELLQLATQTNDVENTAMAIFNLGIATHQQGHTTKGYRLMKKGIDILQKNKTANREQRLFEYQMTIIEFLQDDEKNEEQQEALAQLKTFLKTTTDKQLLTDQRLKDIYAHETVLAHRMGKEEEAKMLYEKFKNTGNAYQYNYKCIEPYLKATARYDDIINFSQQRIDYLYRLGVTGSVQTTFIYRLLADGFMGKGNFQKAAESYEKLSAIKREIIHEGEKGSIEELTSVYELKDIELELKYQIATERLIFFIAITLIVVSSLIILYYRALKYNRKMKRKNKKMAALLDESLQKKKERRTEEGIATVNTDEPDADRELFDNVWNELIEHKLYLDPNLNRETLLQKFRIPKNRFSPLFTKYAGMSYSQSINTLRLEHAIELLQEYPNYTIEWIAEQCGMTTATLYRLFSQRYGMTPAEYREAKKPEETGINKHQER